MLANGFLLLVGASPPRIENRLKITKLEFYNLVFELAPSKASDTIYVVSRREQALQSIPKKIIFPYQYLLMLLIGSIKCLRIPFVE